MNMDRPLEIHLDSKDLKGNKKRLFDVFCLFIMPFWEEMVKSVGEIIVFSRCFS